MYARKVLTSCLLSLACCVSIYAQGYTGNLTFVQASSNLAFSGDLSFPPLGIPFTPFTAQAGPPAPPASMTTSYTGTVNITIDLTTGAIVFNGASAVAAISGNWTPDALLTLAPGPANYGINHAGTGTTAAIRNLSMTMTSGYLALTGGPGSYNFGSTQTLAYLPGGSLDYNSSLLGAAHSPLSGSVANTNPTAGTLTNLGNGSFTLSLPFDAKSLITSSGVTIGHTDLNGTLFATGTLVAIPEPTTYALIGLSLGMAGYFSYRHKKRLKNLEEQKVVV
ncbi:MAG: PEP-CTERM sorting domain-containing protein [Gemmatales bacterium]